ncbi:MAG: hypothetical protein JW820_08350 [Spirochaetales bacterium]|nr:hypothetical protein [Spirochaetales bacterium]
MHEPSPAPPDLEPEEWDFGTVSAAASLERELTIVNPGRRQLAVSFVSTCDCLTVTPERVKLPVGEMPPRSRPPAQGLLNP